MRIRTVKPDYWQSEQPASVSREVRLLGLGLLNVADDEGYFRAHPGVIAGQLFPYDADGYEFVRGALPELVGSEWIEMDPVSGLGRIRKFAEHQRVDKPRPSNLKRKWGIAETSWKVPGILKEASKEEGKGNRREGKGREVASAGGVREKSRPLQEQLLGAENPEQSEHQAYIAALTAYARSIDPGWQFGDGRSGKAVKELRKHPLPEVMARWDRGWAIPAGKFGSTRTPADLVTHWNRLGENTSNGAAPLKNPRKGIERAEDHIDTHGPEGPTNF
jgi:hypothetical protein